jgi:hypothetical protein
MPAPFTVSLSLAVVLVLGSRFVLPTLPLSRYARPLTALDAAFLAIGLAGLGFHCGSMFFTSLVDAVPGTGRAINEINAMGAASKIGYAIPAALVVLGFRHQHPAALMVVAAALAAVGITMYDNGALSTHLTAIFVAVVVIAGVVSLLAVPSPPVRTGLAAQRD